MTKITWFINLLFSVFALIFLFYSAVANTAPPILVDQQTGRYLGNLSSNPYDSKSTSNSYGKYGSKYSPDSINNLYGQYGSEYSNDSPNNPYATNPPVIIDSNEY
jgi:hypothetical protein